MASLLMPRCILFVFLFGSIICTQATDCIMNNFPVQANFDETRFEGKWYEAGWIVQPWILQSWIYSDYIHNKTKTDFGFSAYIQGRSPENATQCDSARTRNFYRTGENAKYLYEYMGPTEMINSSHWVVDTDYDNYALIYGCREVASNGTCTGVESWMWTRCQKPPMKYVTYMEGRLSDFCLSKDQFHTSVHNTDCNAAIPDSCQQDSGAIATTPGGMSVLVISIAVAIKSSYPTLETWLH